MSLRRMQTGVLCIAVAASLSACGASPPPTLHKLPAFSAPFIPKSTVLATFRAQGILLQKTFGDNIQTSYDGISTTALGLHLVGMIVYPRQQQGAGTIRGGAGNPITIANVEIWIDPELSPISLASVHAAITALAAACGCASPTLALVNGLVAIKSGTWNGNRWVLKAGDIADGQYCVELNFRGSRAHLLPQSCGSIHPSNLSRYFKDIGVDVQPRALGLPGAILGAIVSTARTVQIDFTDGTTETVPTIAPRAGLSAGIRFYVAPRPCRATFTMIIGRDAKARRVALAKSPRSRTGFQPGVGENCQD